MCGLEVWVVEGFHGLRVDFRVGVKVGVRYGAGRVGVVEGRVGVG